MPLVLGVVLVIEPLVPHGRIDYDDDGEDCTLKEFWRAVVYPPLR